MATGTGVTGLNVGLCVEIFVGSRVGSGVGSVVIIGEWVGVGADWLDLADLFILDPFFADFVDGIIVLEDINREERHHLDEFVR